MECPPFQVEDQTDEDFFDKLVADDDDFRVTEFAPSFAEGEESDEVKAFSNLSIGEADTVLEDSGAEGGVTAKEEMHSDVAVAQVSDVSEDILVTEASDSRISSNLFTFDNGMESSDAAAGVDVALNSITSKSSGGLGITSVKEVQWSLFNSDPTQHSGNGFGSYSDFFTELVDNSADPFQKAGDYSKADSNTTSSIPENTVAKLTSSFSSVQHHEDQAYGEATLEQTSDGQDLNGSQNWENLYPGWRYDPNTGEWRQLDGSDAIETQGILGSNVQSVDNGFVLDQKSEVSYLQETAQSVGGSIAEGCTTSYNSNWNQVSQGSTEYPPHMVFDPQYPGWYYDTITQEWRLLESYDLAIQSTTIAHDQQNQNENALKGGSFPADDHNLYNEHGKIKEYGSQGLGYQDQGGDWTVSTSNYTQQNTNIWQPGTIIKSDSGTSFAENQQFGNLYGSRDLVNNYADQLMGFQSMETVSLYKQTNHSYESSNGVTGYQSFLPAEKFSQQLNQPNMEQSQQMHFSHDYSGSQNSGNFSQQLFQAGAQFSYAPNEKRSSAGRPPHALVAFGFGGKLIVMKDGSAFGTNSVYGSQESEGGSISLLKLMEVVMDRTEAASDYFFTLCQQSFPGPLVGGNIGSKELNRWIDERIANCGSPNMDYRKGGYLKLLLSLLKIACQHYGKLRSPFGTDAALKESDCPELAVAKLFASAKRNHTQLSEYGALTHCLHNLPSEGQIQATAIEVQNLLVSGRTKEALQRAQEGQLWGTALVLAAHLGDQLYVDTVMQMAHRQLVAGSPLRTLCLLIAGKPADVFSTGSTTMSGIPAAINISQQSTQVIYLLGTVTTQIGANGMLDDWEENLAIITGNRTKGDELVLIYLGDCLLKERGEITAAHICYLVAEANFESYSNSARMCLIGADHWKFPRTYASPEAIQRTELYEYSMVLGNSQSILLPFQPYKLLYAHMLAEVGKISDSLKYCQAILKSLKTGRAPELETWKQLVSSLEERIRTHQQGGYGTNLAPAKLVGKLLPFIDRSIHRMIGAPPSPVPSISQSSVQNNEHDHLLGPRVANSQSTMTMSSLMPSASMEPISDWSDDIKTMPNRSISAPDFGRSPRQDRINPSKDAASSNAQVKASVSGGSSRFGLFGSQIFQKTMGWVSRSRPDRQAKLGEKNKFYYDEKLKRWVEEGAEPPAEEAALPPPPTAAFQNGSSDYNIKTALRSESLPANEGPEIKSPAYLDRSSGIPPIPPSSNQFSARGRMGVRSRYVDTFNKGGGTPTNLFQSPSVPAAKPGSGANAKFFIPTAAPSGEQTVDATKESTQKINASNEDSATSVMDSSFPSLSSSSSLPMQRFPSMNDIAPIGNKGMGVMGNGNSSFSSHSRRTASWGGSMTEMVVPKTTEIKSLGKTLRMAPPSFIPTDLSSTHPQMNFSSTHQQMNGRRLGDELHEVEL